MYSQLEYFETMLKSMAHIGLIKWILFICIMENFSLINVCSFLLLINPLATVWIFKQKYPPSYYIPPPVSYKLVHISCLLSCC